MYKQNLLKKIKIYRKFLLYRKCRRSGKNNKSNKKKYFDARHNCIAYRVIEKGQIVEKI